MRRQRFLNYLSHLVEDLTIICNLFFPQSNLQDKIIARKKTGKRPYDTKGIPFALFCDHFKNNSHFQFCPSFCQAKSNVSNKALRANKNRRSTEVKIRSGRT